jgi:gliding motility-associated protein GldM
MTLNGKEDPMFAKNEDARTKDWVQLSFDHTPQIAALAFLTEKQARVANYEAEILSKIQKSLGATDLAFDEVFAMASAESRVVAAGTKYKADLFITARSSSKSFKPEMTMNGSQLKVQDAKGKVEFKASLKGGKPVKGNKNMVRKSWKGTIKMKDPTGKEQTFSEQFEYFVSKPVIQIQSASVSALYKNCGNELNVQVPALGEAYNPAFGVTGGSQRKGAKKGMVTIIPTAPKVKLSVSSGGQLIGSQEFKVRLVPKPEIVAYAKGKPVDQKKGMKAPGPRSIQMKAISDKSFKEFLPKDARYKVSSWEAILVRGKRPVKKKNFTSSDGNLSSFAASAKPGDRILIEVKKVIRRNFQNKSENVPIGTTIMNIPLTD